MVASDEPLKLDHADLRAMADWLLPLARAAGVAIMDIYAMAQAHPRGSASALLEHKADESPLTEADLAAHQTIVSGLVSHTPEIPIISEESFKPEQMRTVGARFWLVDPLDGTKEFLSGTGEFTVNIALIEDRKPVLGVVYQPTVDELFWGGLALGAWRRSGSLDASLDEAVGVLPRAEPPWRVLASRSHLGPQTRELIKRMGKTELLQAGSSLKFCRIASGQADFYPRLGFTSQWDTAAAQAVLEGAGGYVMDVHGHPLRYGQADIINSNFLASALPYDRVRQWWGV